MPRFPVGQCDCMDEEYQCSQKTAVSTLLSVIISTGRPFPQPTLQVQKVHINGIMGTTILINESIIHISYSENHDSILFFYYFYMSPFQPSPTPLLRVVIFRSVLLLMLQNYIRIVLISHRLAAFRSQCEWTRISISLPTPMAMGNQLGFKRHRKGHYSSQCSRKPRFRHYYQ